MYDIGGEAPVARECSVPPKTVLDEACAAIAKAKFTGKADEVTVPHMLAAFEWIVRSTFEQALERHATSGATLPPAARRAVAEARRSSGSSCSSTCLSTTAAAWWRGAHVLLRRLCGLSCSPRELGDVEDVEEPLTTSTTARTVLLSTSPGR